ncbi:DegT/DnrJ/EryC1/StrS family aminotransferase [Neptuniibacter sp. QD37_6]|uniref:DegT/DnrJ/EryC1/StrS family aminotransferase n=1 Tax=Neptuniibacter sp. QD37_6 TaxID=3398210 RepID=UPI0039F550D2
MSNQDFGSVLALHGGEKTIKEKFARYSPIGEEEVKAASEVVSSGVLSQYLGCWSDDFYGGPKVQEFERQCETYFGVKHAITVNSWTSGLVAAVGALGVEPGDEVIVSPWTMCASATAILHWNAIPVFADIENDTFCLDPVAVEKCISPRTKAIMAIDIGGQSADLDALREIADKHGLKIISDTAQAPGALYKGKLAGTLADIGGYSLNYHKHIHTGEGGVLVTNDDELADRMRLIRNHAEAVVEDKGVTNLVNMLGHNFRLGEIECAIGIEQLKKLDPLIKSRQVAADQLSEGLSGLKGLKLPVTRKDCTHVYYVYKMMIDPEVTGVSRNKIFEALVAEGVEGLSTKFANLHLLPLYQKKVAYGSNGFPWRSDVTSREVSYEKGICPVAEDLHDTSYLGFLMCLHEMQYSEIELIIQAFKKVWDNLDKLVDD